MRKILSALTLTIVILLILTRPTLTTSNTTPSNGMEINAEVEESVGETEKSTQATQTSITSNEHENQMAEGEAKEPIEACQTLESQSMLSKEENVQTLENSENPAQTNNSGITPPDGRIYYPTSSEEPYAYTPTYTPKGKNMPIEPTIPQN
jgi:cell division protein FtsX